MNVVRVLIAASSITIAASCGEGAAAGKLDERLEFWNSQIRSNLPLGTPLAQAMDFFAKSGLDHGFDHASHTIQAIERDVTKNFPVSWSVTIKCQFDSSDKLQSCEAKKVGTGP